MNIRRNKKDPNELKILLVGFFGAMLLRILRKTLRIEKVTDGGKFPIWPQQEPIILAFWHNQQLMMPWIYLDSRPSSLRKPIHVLISKSLDGRFIAKAMKILGIGSVAGSSSRGGKEALIKLVRIIKDGSHVAITPDGPKGPLHKAKAGALKVSQLTGARILPVAFAAKKLWTFNSWDKMILPKPFSKALMLSGEAFLVPRDTTEAEVNSLMQKLEDELNRITSKAQELLW